MAVEIRDGGILEPIAICGMGKLSPCEHLHSPHANRL